jgi:hypothetical protein
MPGGIARHFVEQDNAGGVSAHFERARQAGLNKRARSKDGALDEKAR